MKCKKSKKYILLEQSGELPAWKERILTGHLRGCVDCRQFRDDTRFLTKAAADVTGDAEVSDFALHRIREAARSATARRNRRKQRIPRERFNVLWRPAMVCAGVFVLLLAGSLILRSKPGQVEIAAGPASQTVTTQMAWENGLDNEIARLGENLVVAWEDLGQTESYENTESAEELAREILMLEESS